ncbi:DUF1592 domain-containing protein [Bremerella alba]|nr:DUF1592 domain-containing protein [Bremerella alba]
MNKIFTLAILPAVLLLTTVRLEANDESLPSFLRTHCVRCHNEESQEGDFRIDAISQDFGSPTDSMHWAEIRERINSGEMPPESEPQPTTDEISSIVAWISKRLAEGEAARMAMHGPVAHFRLSNEEYANTIYDLLGVRFEAERAGVFNEDPRWHGFSRIGSELTLSPSHLERYYDAAETIVSRASSLAAHPPKPGTRLRDNNANRPEWLDKAGIVGPVRDPLLPGMGTMIGNLRDAGRYRFRVQLSAMPSRYGVAPHISVRDRKTKQSHYEVDVVAPEKEPTIIEFEITANERDQINLANVAPGSNLSFKSSAPQIFIDSQQTQVMSPRTYKLTDEDGKAIYPLLLIDWVEVKGPLTDESELESREGLFPEDQNEDIDQVAIRLHQFMERAWRRPVRDVELDAYIALIESELSAGESLSNAYQAALTSVLTSKNFLYLIEGDAQKKRSQLNDWELASRLSCFLWGSMPDEALFAAAREGNLHEPKELRRQVQRMFSDPKIERFLTAFPEQWLQLHRLGMFPPDNRLYPEYDYWLEESMRMETLGFFREVFENDLSIREFLDSDWTMVTSRLAEHYNLSPVEKSGLQRVSLRPEDHRGGLLSQAAILSLTSDGTRHRPVHRGVFVSEAIFAKTPPPPPANVEPLVPVPGSSPKATVRMQLEAHSKNANCAACHKNIDPLGFAFDNYDAIGRWYAYEVVHSGQGDNPKVDASGILPSGDRFQNPAEFRALLANDMPRFSEAMFEHLATFALRRTMTVNDTDDLQALVETSQATDYRLKSMIEAFVLSDLFQKR